MQFAAFVQTHKTRALRVLQLYRGLDSHLYKLSSQSDNIMYVRSQSAKRARINFLYWVFVWQYEPDVLIKISHELETLKDCTDNEGIELRCNSSHTWKS